MIAEDIPQWLKKYIDKTAETLAFEKDKHPNHVLVNEYLPEQGIMPHLDGPIFYPTICTISCGSHTVLNYHPQQNIDDSTANNDIIHSLLLERRSLVIVQEDMYHLYPHSIQEKKTDVLDEKIANLHLCSRTFEPGEELARGTRVSLTIRHVPQTSKFKIKLGR